MGRVCLRSFPVALSSGDLLSATVAACNFHTVVQPSPPSESRILVTADRHCPHWVPAQSPCHFLSLSPQLQPWAWRSWHLAAGSVGLGRGEVVAAEGVRQAGWGVRP